MKLKFSEFIARLQELYEQYGDMEHVITVSDDGLEMFVSGADCYRHTGSLGRVVALDVLDGVSIKRIRWLKPLRNEVS